MKLNQGVSVYIDRETMTIKFVQLASKQNQTKLAKEFDWLNNEFLCTYEVE